MVKFLKILFVIILFPIVSIGQISTKEVEKLLYKYDIKHPEIVLRIGILESGWFTSNKAVNHKNIFGFETGKKVFSSYDEAVLAYKNRVESRLKKGENYYKFLRRIEYAEDKLYIKKLKSIEYKLNKYVETSTVISDNSIWYNLVSPTSASIYSYGGSDFTRNSYYIK